MGVAWLTKLFNKIINSKKMPDEWMMNILVPIFKNKGDILSCSNYREIKLMSHVARGFAVAWTNTHRSGKSEESPL